MKVQIRDLDVKICLTSLYEYVIGPHWSEFYGLYNSVFIVQLFKFCYNAVVYITDLSLGLEGFPGSRVPGVPGSQGSRSYLRPVAASKLAK